MKYQIFVDILFLIGVVYLFISCNKTNDISRDYRIDYYTDTINGHIILSTVVSSESYNNVSVSSIELKDN